MANTDAGLEHLKGLCALKQVELHGTSITASGVESLQKSLPDCSIYPTPEMLSAQPKDKPLWPQGRKPSREKLLAVIKELEMSSEEAPFSATPTTSVKIDESRPGKPVVEFMLFDSDISDASLLRILNEMPELEQLHLGSLLVGDELAKGLARFKKLKVLQLRNTRVTDEGVKHIAKLSELRELNLQATWFTDVGLMELRHLKKLKQLVVGGTRTTNLWLFLLQESLPDCQINF